MYRVTTYIYVLYFSRVKGGRPKTESTTGYGTLFSSCQTRKLRNRTRRFAYPSKPYYDYTSVRFNILYTVHTFTVHSSCAVDSLVPRERNNNNITRVSGIILLYVQENFVHVVRITHNIISEFVYCTTTRRPY